MSHTEETSYYDDLAEGWEGSGYSGGSGGSGGSGVSAKTKKKKAPSTVGKRRLGGTQAWGFSEKVCKRDCTKKCCNGAVKKPPSIIF